MCHVTVSADLLELRVYVFALSLFYWALGLILGFLSIPRAPLPGPRAFHFHHGVWGLGVLYTFSCHFIVFSGIIHLSFRFVSF